MKKFKEYLLEQENNTVMNQEDDKTEDVDDVLDRISFVAGEIKKASESSLNEDWMLLAVETAELELVTLLEYLQYQQEETSLEDQ